MTATMFLSVPETSSLIIDTSYSNFSRCVFVYERIKSIHPALFVGLYGSLAVCVVTSCNTKKQTHGENKSLQLRLTVAQLANKYDPTYH